MADNLIFCEKIGLSNYYWSFPSQALVTRTNKKVTWEEGIQAKKRRREELAEEEAKLEEERQSNDGEREKKLARYNDLRSEEEALDSELRLLSANDPELIDAVKEDIQIARTAIERWTDNLYTVKKICMDKAGCNEEQIDQSFDTAKMVYLED